MKLKLPMPDFIRDQRNFSLLEPVQKSFLYNLKQILRFGHCPHQGSLVAGYCQLQEIYLKRVSETAQDLRVSSINVKPRRKNNE